MRLLLSLHYLCSLYMFLFGSEKTAGVWERELIFSKHYQKHDPLPVFYVRKILVPDGKLS